MQGNSIWKIYMLAILLWGEGCATSRHVIAKRDPAPVAAKNKIEVHEIKKPEEPEPPKELFTRKKTIQIKSTNPVNDSGTLVNLNDSRSYLYGFEKPVEVGGYLDIKLASNRGDTPPATSGSPAASNPAQKQDAKEVSESELLKSLPDLTPGPAHKPVLIKNLKMQVMEKRPNGDAVVQYRRRTMRDGIGEEVVVNAVLPASALLRSDQLTSADLNQIDWKETSNGQLVERQSANWEDEYSLRLSGFDEIKSKEAHSLEEKRERLSAAKDKLTNEIKSFSKERENMTKERSKLLEQKSKDDARVGELEKENNDLKKQVEDLTPKEEDEDAKSDDKKAADTKKSSPPAKANDKKNDTKLTDKKPAKEAASKKETPKKEPAKSATAPKPSGANNKKKG